MSLSEWSWADHRLPDGDVLLHASFVALGKFHIHAVLVLTRLFQEGEPLPAPVGGLLSTTRKWTVRGGTRADEVRDFTGKGHRAESSGVWAPRRTALPGGPAALGFLAMGSFSSLSPVVRALLSQDGCQRDGGGRWTDTWCLLLTFPKLFRLVVA